MAGEVLEELIYELYTLKGYFCLRNIPAKTKKAGGRDEIDIIAIKFENNKPNEVVWIEVTEFLSGGEKGLRYKFAKDKEEYIKKYLREFYNITWSKEIKKICYTSTDHPRTKKRPNLPANLISMKEILEEVQQAIDKYKPIYHKISEAKSDPDYLTLPDSYKNIKLIERVRNYDD